MYDLIINAAQFAAQAHANQKRKWTKTPYIEHPMRVAGRVCMIEGCDEEMVAAAWLHDVSEDCGTPIGQLERRFGETVANLVQELTNSSKKFPHLSRAQRKEMDRNILACASTPAKLIKCVDRIDNLQEMTGAEASFVSLYVAESLLLAQVLDDSYVVRPYAQAIREACAELNAAT
jgi:(p)ppGpp synthase/HD superfamily hydrolase